MGHYLSNAVLRTAIVAWQTECTESGERVGVSDELAVSLLRLAGGLIQRFYRSHPHRDDLRSAAVLTALEQLHHFDASASDNAFGWLTQVMRNAMRRQVTIVETHEYHDLAYAAEYHRGDATVRELLTDPVVQDRLAYHTQRLADIRTKRAETPKPPQPRRTGKLTLPDGQQVTAARLATMLGVTAPKLRRRLDANKSVAEILAEFGPISGKT